MKKIILIGLTFFLLFGGNVMADTGATATANTAHLGSGGLGLTELGSPETVEDLVKMVMKFLGVTIIFASVLGFMIGGSFLIFSAGQENVAERGKSILLASVIGLSVTLLSYLIVTLVQSLLYSF